MGVLVGMVALATAVHAQAPAVQEYPLKAALLFNVAKYTDWPESAFTGPQAPIVIGILGTDPFGEALDRVVRDRRINGRSIEIRRATGVGPLLGAHLVFVSAAEPRAAQDCAALERAGILTVGDGGVTTLYTAISFAVDQDRVVFHVDLARSKHAGVQVSATLLQFARSVRQANGVVAR